MENHLCGLHKLPDVGGRVVASVALWGLGLFVASCGGSAAQASHNTTQDELQACISRVTPGLAQLQSINPLSAGYQAEIQAEETSLENHLGFDYARIAIRAYGWWLNDSLQRRSDIADAQANVSIRQDCAALFSPPSSTTTAPAASAATLPTTPTTFEQGFSTPPPGLLTALDQYFSTPPHNPYPLNELVFAARLDANDTTWAIYEVAGAPGVSTVEPAGGMAHEENGTWQIVEEPGPRSLVGCHVTIVMPPSIRSDFGIVCPG